jgi:hypothetical protein
VSKGSEKFNEFRRYRQVLAGLYIGTVTAGFLLLAVSVARQLLFRSPAVQLAGPVLSSEDPDPALLLACNDQVAGLFRELGDATTRLMAIPAAHGDGESSARHEISARWETFSREWLHRWDVVNARCSFSQLADTHLGTAYDRMAKVHGDLPAVRLKYQSLLVRFEAELSAELARMHRALALSREGLSERAEQASDEAHRP